MDQHYCCICLLQRDDSFLFVNQGNWVLNKETQDIKKWGNGTSSPCTWPAAVAS